MLGPNRVELVFDEFKGVNGDILRVFWGGYNPNSPSSSFLSSSNLLVEERSTRFCSLRLFEVGGLSYNSKLSHCFLSFIICMN